METSNHVKDREVWHAAVHGVTKSQTQRGDWTTVKGRLLCLTDAVPKEPHGAGKSQVLTVVHLLGVKRRMYGNRARILFSHREWQNKIGGFPLAMPEWTLQSKCDGTFFLAIFLNKLFVFRNFRFTEKLQKLYGAPEYFSSSFSFPCGYHLTLWCYFFLAHHAVCRIFNQELNLCPLR